MSPLRLKLILVLFVFLILGFFTFQTYSFYYNEPSNSPIGNYDFTISKGGTFKEIATKLAQDKVITSDSVLNFHERFNPINNLQTGKFTLKLPAKPENIVLQIQTQNQEIIKKISKENQRISVNVTFREGIRLDDIIKILDENQIATKKELEEFVRNPDNFDRKTFPFLPKSLSCSYGDLPTCAKYYPEGYLYPDTYSFFKPSKPSEIFSKILKNFENKVWNKIEPEIGNKNLEKIIIIASVIEKESGRPIGGVNKDNLEEVNKERKLIASSFYNRIESGMKWQSDPSGTYWSGKTFCQQTLSSLSDCIYLDSPEAQNQYNTYNVKNYPIAPITSPQLDNILAALNPIDSEFLFFVSDATGRKYFAKTNSEHEENIFKAQTINENRNSKQKSN